MCARLLPQYRFDNILFIIYERVELQSSHRLHMPECLDMGALEKSCFAVATGGLMVMAGVD